MAMFQQLIIPGVIGIITIVISWLLNRKFNKAQTEGLIADQYYKLTERLRQEREDLESRINRNDVLIQSLEKKDRENRVEIRTLKEDNEECKYQHEVKELEIRQIKKQTDAHDWKREMVFVLDDDDDELEDFRQKFKKISTLEYEGFHDVDRFLEAAKKSKPPIIVLDYILNRGHTAEYVIENIGYEPEVFIMSGEKKFLENFKSDGIRFFEKNDNHILKIAKAIIQHLISKS